MARVKLISCTPNAEALLLFTKNTRLEMSTLGLSDMELMSDEERAKELKAMARTIRSSWEFVDYTFLITGVTRAVAQQITRTRTASFAMQSMRVVDSSKSKVVNPFDESSAAWATFDQESKYIKDAYTALIEDHGAKLEDARGILPLNTACNLVAKYNLRTIVETIAQRESLRAQGEYADIAREMKKLVLQEHPSFEVFFSNPLQEAIDILTEVVSGLDKKVGSGPAWEISKAIDLIRKHA